MMGYVEMVNTILKTFFSISAIDNEIKNGNPVSFFENNIQMYIFEQIINMESMVFNMIIIPIILDMFDWNNDNNWKIFNKISCIIMIVSNIVAGNIAIYGFNSVFLLSL